MALMLIDSVQKYPLLEGNNLGTWLSRSNWGYVIGQNSRLECFIPTNGGVNFPVVSNFARSGKPAFGFTGIGNPSYLTYGGQNNQGYTFDDEVSVGFSLYNGIPGGDPAIYLQGDDHHFEVWDSNTAGSRIHFTVAQSRANNNLLIKYKGYAEVAVIPFGQTYNTSTYYEISVRLSTGSNGVIKVRRNGTEIYNVSGIQTANSWYSGSIGYVALGNTNRTNGFFSIYKLFSDIQITNDLNPLGEIRVDALFPSANGTHTEFSAVGSQSNHWDNVNDKPNSDDGSTYNFALVGSNLIEDYTIESIPSVPNVNTIFAIQVSDTLKKSDVGIASINSMMYNKVSNTYSYFPTIDGASNPPLSTSFSQYRYVANTDPFTLVQWTKESLANVQFGYNIP